MRKYLFLGIGILILIFGGLSFLFVKGFQNKNISTEQNGNNEKQITAPKVTPKSFPVANLPAFAAEDCAQRGGTVQKLTEKGETREKCVFNDL